PSVHRPELDVTDDATAGPVTTAATASAGHRRAPPATRCTTGARRAGSTGDPTRPERPGRCDRRSSPPARHTSRTGTRRGTGRTLAPPATPSSTRTASPYGRAGPPSFKVPPCADRCSLQSE